MAKRGINLLDDLQIRRWIAAGLATAKSDGAGLTFTLSKAGTASWILRYMREGKPKELTLGNYPDISLAAARRTARAKRVEIDEGHDPAATKKVERIKTKLAWTVNNLMEDYLLKRLTEEELSLRGIYYRKWDMERIIKPNIGSIEVRRVSPTDIVQMIEKADRSWSVSRRILTTAVMIFRHAVGKQLIVANPCTALDLTAIIGKRPAIKRRIMLTEGELRTLLVEINQLGKTTSLVFRVLLATCVRSAELRKAKWEDVDFSRGTWYVPDDSVKTRVGFLVPITPTVIGWFKELHELAEGSIWVVPSKDARRIGKHTSDSTLRSVISAAFDRGVLSTRRFTPHDTRSTAKGHMRNLGVSREISEIALNHTLKGMDGIYDVREEIPERREALEKWAAFIVACESGSTDGYILTNKPTPAE